MRTVAHVIADLETAGYIWQVMKFESLEQFVECVEAGKLKYLSEWFDHATNTFNWLVENGVLDFDDQLILNDWLVDCQRRCEEAMKARVDHVIV